LTDYTLKDLGWSPFFAAQTDPEMLGLAARIATVARDRLGALTPSGPITLHTSGSTGDFAVGDWVLTTPDGTTVDRLLDRQTCLKRRAAGHNVEAQLIAANVETFGIVTSCNADFNIARLERYLALAASAGCQPLVILTKADLTDDARDYARRAEALSPLVTAVTLNATDPAQIDALAPWCKDGQTLVLAGSSGVGKSTLSNLLTGGAAATQAIREDDAKGRHTTTSRDLARTLFGGWLIDTPGMRSLPLTGVADGIEAVFEDIEALTAACKFSDCAHETEPGCAVTTAIKAGDLDADRLARWQKLKREDANNSAALHEARARDKSLHKTYRGAQSAKKKKRGA
jgi:ribosome biogenesis GTPase / thiamine phosphate phosphatase